MSAHGCTLEVPWVIKIMKIAQHVRFACSWARVHGKDVSINERVVEK